MILFSVLIKAYTTMLFLTITDEAWNMHNPRPVPQGKYIALQWEQKDFYSYKIDGEWVLRKHRKTDSDIKRIVRKKYWRKRNEKHLQKGKRKP